jgi:hypothetical protein
MRRSPPLAPGAPYDVTVHIVLDDFGDLGRAYRETVESEADVRTVIDNVLRGEYARPVRVVAFNTAKGVAHDVSAGIARAVVERARKENRELSEGARRFLEEHLTAAELPRVSP